MTNVGDISTSHSIETEGNLLSKEKIKFRIIKWKY